MKKLDIIIVICILIIAISFLGVNQYKSYFIQKNSKEIWAEIYVEGELYRVVLLVEEEQEFIIETNLGRNVIMVHDHVIEVIEADCLDYICQSTGYIDKPGEIIVCLPNQFVIEIKGQIEEEINGLR